MVYMDFPIDVAHPCDGRSSVGLSVEAIVYLRRMHSWNELALALGPWMLSLPLC
jgi:hypothetical protein